MESVFKLLYHIHTHIHSTNASTQNDAYDVWQMNSVCLYRKMYRCTPMEFKEREREKTTTATTATTSYKDSSRNKNARRSTNYESNYDCICQTNIYALQFFAARKLKKDKKN